MPHSKLPQSVADWFAAVITLATIVVLVGLLAVAPQALLGAAPVATGLGWQVQARNAATTSSLTSHVPAKLVVPACRATELTGGC